MTLLHTAISPTIILNVWRLLQVISFLVVNRVVHEPYMDEIFHVPQAQAYCQGEFGKYDEKLTTPPGIYLVSFVLHSLGFPCSLPSLRGLNLCIGTLLLPHICGRINGQLHGHDTKYSKSWAECLALMPILSFFSLVYYTDLGSTYLVLLTYYLTITERPLSAAITGFLSLWFRQTNLVWIAAFTAMRLVGKLEASQKTLRTKRIWRSTTCYELLADSLQLARMCILQISIATRALAPIMPSLIFAAGFVYINGAIVLGDKTMHKAGFYPIQMTYMISFCIVISAVSFLQLRYVKRCLSIMRRPISIALLVLTCCVLARQKEFQHPFVLSDNRHYTFYINKRLLQPVPAFVLGSGFALASILMSLRVDAARSMTVLTLSVAATFTLIPSSLLEFRYYVVPFLLWRLHASEVDSSDSILALEAWVWIAVHMSTTALFLFRGFSWPGQAGVQRFMW